jgi:hypothetical protein
VSTWVSINPRKIRSAIRNPRNEKRQRLNKTLNMLPLFLVLKSLPQGVLVRVQPSAPSERRREAQPNASRAYYWLGGHHGGTRDVLAPRNRPDSVRRSPGNERRRHGVPRA